VAEPCSRLKWLVSWGSHQVVTTYSQWQDQRYFEGTPENECAHFDALLLRTSVLLCRYICTYIAISVDRLVFAVPVGVSRWVEFYESTIWPWNAGEVLSRIVFFQKLQTKLYSSTTDGTEWQHRMTDQGPMLWSQFSAIFTNFRWKNWRFSQKPMLWSQFLQK
jgi:hypothetical protein